MLNSGTLAWWTVLSKLQGRRASRHYIAELCRRALCGDGLEAEEGERSKKVPAEELRVDSVPGVYVPADRHQRAAVLDILFPKMVGSLVEGAPPAEPPHVCMMYGAWQRRAVLGAAMSSASSVALARRFLRYGFYADGNITEPKLLCKTIEQYESRLEKDFCETIVVMIAVGPADPALPDPNDVIPPDPPAELMLLGPLHVSEDAVVGNQEGKRFFPPGYSDPEPKPKPKIKKKKKTKRHETKEEVTEELNIEATESAETVEGNDAEADGDGELEPEGEAEAEGEGEGEGEEETNGQTIDKATSPPPPTPH